ncbi:hypothetical protein B0H14DRAFT_2613712 [Mycena olivaceomarginata]|nr:hypothetical protein B0H14DRAFT_2613712 [Mycena olivaceomarginata]
MTPHHAKFVHCLRESVRLGEYFGQNTWRALLPVLGLERLSEARRVHVTKEIVGNEEDASNHSIKHSQSSSTATVGPITASGPPGATYNKTSALIIIWPIFFTIIDYYWERKYTKSGYRGLQFAAPKVKNVEIQSIFPESTTRIRFLHTDCPHGFHSLRIHARAPAVGAVVLEAPVARVVILAQESVRHLTCCEFATLRAKGGTTYGDASAKFEQWGKVLEQARRSQGLDSMDTEIQEQPEEASHTVGWVPHQHDRGDAWRVARGNLFGGASQIGL